MTNKRINYYLALPYKYTLYPAEEGGYVIEIPDLPGCITQAETADEVLAMIEDAKRGWIEIALEQGIEIPETVKEDYSGKFKAWDYALGTIKVDGLEPSPEFLELVEKEKRGEITTNDIIKTLNERYKMKEEGNGEDA